MIKYQKLWLFTVTLNALRIHIDNFPVSVSVLAYGYHLTQTGGIVGNCKPLSTKILLSSPSALTFSRPHSLGCLLVGWFCSAGNWTGALHMLGRHPAN